MRNISKLMTFIFRNRNIFWDVSKWNRGQKKWDGGSNSFFPFSLIFFFEKLFLYNSSYISTQFENQCGYLMLWRFFFFFLRKCYGEVSFKQVSIFLLFSPTSWFPFFIIFSYKLTLELRSGFVVTDLFVYNDVAIRSSYLLLFSAVVSC